MPTERPRPRIQDSPVSPAKIFDDVYYIGRRVVGVFAITTSEGIVLIDSMDPTDAAEQHIIPSMEHLDLDPAQIKLIIITHGHFDHFAGARHLQKRYGCKVALGQTDTAFMMTSESRIPYDQLEYPHIDFYLEDGKEIVVGDHTFIPILTPGHTPGGMSLIFNCHDNEQEHWVSLWVGAGLPRPCEPVPDRMHFACLFANSALQFELACKQHHCDVVLGVHPHRCDLFPKLEQLNHRAPGDENPFVVGEKGVKENLQHLATEALKLAQTLAEEM